MGLTVLCSGQGGQHPEMFRELAAFAPPPALLAEVAGDLGIAPEALPAEPLAADLYDNLTAQPLLVGYALAAWQALREALPRPVVVAGYSLGEVAAYGVAGAIAAAPLMAIVRRRAALMQAARSEAQAMIALAGCPMTTATRLAAAHGLEIAIVNGPDHVVVGGPAAGVSALERAAGGAGVHHVKRLKVAVASHTRFLGTAVAPFREVLAAASLGAPEVPVVAGIDAGAVRDRARAIETLARQVAEPIRWADCLEQCLALGATAFLELGPGRALTKMLNEMRPDVPARSLSDFRSAAGVARWAERQLS